MNKQHVKENRLVGKQWHTGNRGVPRNIELVVDRGIAEERNFGAVNGDLGIDGRGALQDINAIPGLRY